MPQAVDGGKKSEMGDSFACVLFGVLRKRPAYKGDNEKDSVMADVVMEKETM